LLVGLSENEKGEQNFHDEKSGSGRDFHENFSNMQKILEKLILVKYKK
jgi:hypothetical protein